MSGVSPSGDSPFVATGGGPTTLVFGGVKIEFESDEANRIPIVQNEGSVIILNNWSGKLKLHRTAPPRRSAAGSLPDWLSMVEVTTTDQTPSSSSGSKRPLHQPEIDIKAEGNDGKDNECEEVQTKKIKWITPYKPEPSQEGQHGLSRSGHVSFSDAMSVTVHGGRGDIGSDGERAIYGDIIRLNFDSDALRVQVSKPLCSSIPLVAHSGQFLSSKQLYVVWGGQTHPNLDLEGDALSDEVMCMDTQLNLWFPQKCSGKPPISRTSYSSCILNGNKLVVYGGQRQGKCLHNIHVLDTERWKWSLQKTEGNPPRARKLHTGNSISSNRLIIFGGDDGKQTFNDLHILTAAPTSGCGGWKWEQVPNVRGTPPAPRAGHTSTVICEGRALLVRGGEDPYCQKVYDDAFLLDLHEWIWKKVPLSSFKELELVFTGAGAEVENVEEGGVGLVESSSCLLSNGQIVLFGGRDLEGRTSRSVLVAFEPDLQRIL